MARRKPKASAEDRSEGRRATQPRDIPAKGWRQIALRVKDELSADNISIVAAGIAFYGLLAIFPAIAALVSIYGLIADPANIENHLSGLSSVMPAQAWDILNQQLDKVASGATGRLTFGFLLGLGLTLWSATSGIKTLMTALNITYDEEETRGFIKFNAIALLMTLGAILFAILAIGLVIVLPALFAAIGFGQTAESLLSILRWPLLALAVVFVLAVVYRYAPDRDKPKWRWVSWGSVVATVLWIAASVLFSFYVSNFGSYNETYGSLGAVVILLMWFYISAYLVLLGAELNAEMEHQTAEDTTRGPEQPMGKRDAYVADTVADSR